MSIDLGTVIVIIAVLFFYLRLIILQRERAKRISQQTESPRRKKKKPGDPPPNSIAKYTILSSSSADRVIAGMGVAAVLAGILLYLQWIPWPSAQPLWWLPTALGIVAFSWAFK